jgi:pimeloyl-ACP methyl ester carboxylesterase
VAAKAVEMFPDSYDGALLTNGVLAGGSRGYDYRLDLRVVSQYYCRNHPRPAERQYPLWQGLPADSTMTSADLRARAQECTGYQSPVEERTPEQRRNLADILSVVRIPERTFFSHLNFATFTFRDIVHERLGGRNPFSNVGVTYRGSHDDRALNRGVARYHAAPAARRDLSFDSDLTGAVSIPVLSLHALDDPTAFVEHESAYRASLEGAGKAGHLVQGFTREAEHSSLSDSEYATAVDALFRWVREGVRPTPEGLGEACPAYDATYGEGCFFDPAAEPGTYFSRVYPRPGETTWPAITEEQYRRWADAGGIGIDY